MCVCLCVWPFQTTNHYLSKDFPQKSLTATVRHHLPYITLQFGPLCHPAKEVITERLKLHPSGSLWAAWPIFLSTCAFSLLLLSHCLLLCASILTVFSLRYATKTNKTKNILLYRLMSGAAFVSLSTCCSAVLIWFSTMWFVYLYVIVRAIYAASTLEAATLNTNLHCSAAVLLPLYGYLPLLDVSQPQIYGLRLK